MGAACRAGVGRARQGSQEPSRPPVPPQESHEQPPRRPGPPQPQRHLTGADPVVDWSDVRGRPVRALGWGRPRPGTPELVLVPGLGAVGYLPPLALACAGWTRVHLLDVPGSGSRRTAHLPSRLADLERTVAGWLDARGAPPVLLAGHSTGAQAALGATLRQPSAVALVVLAGLSFPPDARRPGPLLRRVLQTARSERPAEVPAVLPSYLRGARRLPELLVTALRDRPEDRVRGLTRPAVVLRGRDDRLCDGAWAERVAAAAPDGRVVVVPGAHNFPFTHPAAASEALRVLR